MLREWNGESNELIIQALEQFGIKAKSIYLAKYEALSPDSFIWYFNAPVDGKDMDYCLYGEDYVPSLDHVVEIMNDYRPEWDHDLKYRLVKVLKPQKWDDTSPVKIATTYPPPENPDEFLEFAATSDFDFVFLGRAESN